MLKRFFKNQQGQNTAEYALLIALVIAGAVAMQTYAQRSLNARVRDAGTYLTTTTNALGNTDQYEPYYSQSSYDVTRNAESAKRIGEGTIGSESTTNRERAAGGYEATIYNGVR